VCISERGDPDPAPDLRRMAASSQVYPGAAPAPSTSPAPPSPPAHSPRCLSTRSWSAPASTPPGAPRAKSLSQNVFTVSSLEHPKTAPAPSVLCYAECPHVASASRARTRVEGHCPGASSRSGGRRPRSTKQKPDFCEWARSREPTPCEKFSRCPLLSLLTPHPSLTASPPRLHPYVRRLWIRRRVQLERPV